MEGRPWSLFQIFVVRCESTNDRGCFDGNRIWAVFLPLLLVLGAAHAQPGRVMYVYTAPQGTPLAEADANGNITATFDYGAYCGQALGSSPAGPGYTGHVNDPDTGFVYMHALLRPLCWAVPFARSGGSKGRVQRLRLRR